MRRALHICCGSACSLKVFFRAYDISSVDAKTLKMDRGDADDAAGCKHSREGNARGWCRRGDDLYKRSTGRILLVNTRPRITGEERVWASPRCRWYICVHTRVSCAFSLSLSLYPYLCLGKPSARSHAEMKKRTLATRRQKTKRISRVWAPREY